MRWFVHVLARLAITATFTTSAAALDAQVERGKSASSANNLWEHLMSNSSEKANSLACTIPSRELRVALRDSSRTTHQDLASRLDLAELDLAGANSLPAVMPAMTRADRRNSTLWSSMSAFFIDGFASYGALYCASVHAIAPPPVESEAKSGQPEQRSARERPSAIEGSR
jgi:hypothetical protein